MSNRRVADALIACATLAYPFIVFFGFQHVSPRVLAGVLIALWAARLASGRLRETAATVWMGIASIGFAAWVWIGGDADQLRWYPVLCSGLLLGVFAMSLYRGMPVAERLARLREPTLSPRAIWYTRQVTRAWCLFFALNSVIAAATALWGSWLVWSVYNGLIAYLIIGLLFAVEYLVRMRFRRGGQS